MRFALLLLALGSVAQWAVAQSSSYPDPADPAAPVAAFKYESVFADYRSFQDQTVASWKSVNDAVSGTPAAGGHAGHHGVMKMPPPVNEAASPSSDAPPSSPMTDHHMHGMGKGEQK